MNIKIFYKFRNNYILILSIFLSVLPFFFGWTKTRLDGIYSILAFVLEFLVIHYIWVAYKKTKIRYKILFFYLCITFLGAFLCDFIYFFVINVAQQSRVSIFWTSLYCLPHLLSIVFLALFWMVYTVRYVHIKNKYLIFFVFLTLDLLFLIIFVYDSSWAIKINTYQGIFNILTGFIDIFIFNFVILCLITSKNKTFNLFTIGCMLYIIYNIWLKYLFINFNITAYQYGEFLEIISLFIILNASYKISKNSLELRRSSNAIGSIKVQLTLFVYLMFISSFCILLFLAMDFSMINTKSLASFPVLIMLYSFGMVVIANYIGEKFEKPFKVLMANTENIIKNNDFKSIHKYNYGILEFDRLQKFITKQLKINDQSIKSQKNLNQRVMKSIHDIRSPLTVIDHLLNNIETNLKESEVIKFKKQLMFIRNIANSLLDYNRYVVNNISNETSYHVLTSSLALLAENKLLEWGENIISLNIPSNIIWLKYLESEFQNTLSNILNNAYEAFNEKDVKHIEIKVTMESKYIQIVISDNGRGIPIDELENIKKGKSLKVNGNGIGVSSAIEYINSLGGEFMIESFESVGTNVMLTLPFNNNPSWSIDKINFSNHQIIVVDNDPEILEFWQRKLFSKTNDFMLFSDSRSFFEWSRQAINLNNCLVLMDYELGENYINGLEVLLKANISNAILITDYAEYAWLQNQISKTKYYLLPKSTLNIISII